MGLGGDVCASAGNRVSSFEYYEPDSSGDKAKALEEKSVEAIPLACADAPPVFPSSHCGRCHLGQSVYPSNDFASPAEDGNSDAGHIALCFPSIRCFVDLEDERFPMVRM